MKLTDADIERYARQIIVPGIGAGGQARLCAARIVVVGEEPGVRIATLYARALGCTVVPAGSAADAIIVAGCAADDPGSSAPLAGAACPVIWYSLDETQIRSGVVHPPDVLRPHTVRAPATAATDVMHAIAACDAAGTAAAVILGWSDCERESAVALA